MGERDQFGGRIDLRTMPVAQRRPQHVPLVLGIGAVPAFTEAKNAMAVGFHHSRIDPVQRRAGHRPKARIALFVLMARLTPTS